MKFAKISKQMIEVERPSDVTLDSEIYVKFLVEISRRRKKKKNNDLPNENFWFNETTFRIRI